MVETFGAYTEGRMNVSIGPARCAWITVESQRRLSLQMNWAIFVLDKLASITFALRIARSRIDLFRNKGKAEQQQIESALSQFSIPLRVRR
jgi:hypothetical protein